MPKTFPSDAVHKTGRVEDSNGKPVVFGVDCDAVTLTIPNGTVLVFDREQRDLFARLFMAAENVAEAWQREHAEAGDG